jgi:hypothetical protein
MLHCMNGRIVELYRSLIFLFREFHIPCNDFVLPKVLSFTK